MNADFLNSNNPNTEKKTSKRKKRLKEKKKEWRKKKRRDQAIERKKKEKNLENSIFSALWFLKQEEIETKESTRKIEEEKLANETKEVKKREFENAKKIQINSKNEKKRKGRDGEQDKGNKIELLINKYPQATIETRSTKIEKIKDKKMEDGGNDVKRGVAMKRDECISFSKFGCCKFGISCKYKHKYPAFSSLLLFAKMYQEGQSSGEEKRRRGRENESYDSFFWDVVKEFEKYAKIKRFYVSWSDQNHLNGNVYVEFLSERDAITICKRFYARWFSCKQLFPSFIALKKDWNSTLCQKNRNSNPNPKCKGDCRELHVYFNPQFLYQPDLFHSSLPSSNPHSNQKKDQHNQRDYSPKRRRKDHRY